ncbi:hypothetical protein [Deinococcus sp.]|uniref:hypothetical protein n=1 Tax=Deinococcus sp. TaxID=47478 RepID=UPI003CC69445
MKYIGGFFRFWYDFVVGDDWRAALAVVAALVVTALLSHQGFAWVILPLVVLVFLGLSVWRVSRRSP